MLQKSALQIIFLKNPRVQRNSHVMSLQMILRTNQFWRSRVNFLSLRISIYAIFKLLTLGPVSLSTDLPRMTYSFLHQITDSFSDKPVLGLYTKKPVSGLYTINQFQVCTKLTGFRSVLNKPAQYWYHQVGTEWEWHYSVQFQSVCIRSHGTGTMMRS